MLKTHAHADSTGLIEKKVISCCLGIRTVTVPLWAQKETIDKGSKTTKTGDQTALL